MSVDRINSRLLEENVQLSKKIEQLELQLDNTTGRDTESLHEPFNNLRLEYCKCSTNDCFLCSQLSAACEDWMCLEAERDALQERIRLDDIRLKAILKRADKCAIELHELKKEYR